MQNGWTDRDAVWGVGPKEPCIRLDWVQILHGKGHFKRGWRPDFFHDVEQCSDSSKAKQFERNGPSTPSNMSKQHVDGTCRKALATPATYRKKQVERFLPFWQQIERNWTRSIFDNKSNDPAKGAVDCRKANSLTTANGKMPVTLTLLLSMHCFNKFLVRTGV